MDKVNVKKKRKQSTPLRQKPYGNKPVSFNELYVKGKHLICQEANDRYLFNGRKSLKVMI